eukprot:6277093-Pyramimonas_sp.AAC.1
MKRCPGRGGRMSPPRTGAFVGAPYGTTKRISHGDADDVEDGDDDDDNDDDDGDDEGDENDDEDGDDDDDDDDDRTAPSRAEVRVSWCGYMMHWRRADDSIECQQIGWQ